MIEAGTPSQIAWGDGNWVFLDMGFSRDARSCGILVGNGNPTSEQFGAAKRQMVSLAKAARSPLNLVIEAPLSVCFSAAGNPTGRSIEKEGSKTRYWYNGLGCAVMVATLYLIRDFRTAHLSFPVRLFEGFVSYKDRTIPSDHTRDVLLLREIVREPAKFLGSIFAPEKLKQNSTDELFSAFCIAGLDCGVPAVIKHQVSYKLDETEADMARTRRVSSTTLGHVNPQQQRVIRWVGPNESFPGQYVYELECQRVRRGGGICGHRYGANGCDIDGAGGGKGRQCPACQGGCFRRAYMTSKPRIQRTCGGPSVGVGRSPLTTISVNESAAEGSFPTACSKTCLRSCDSPKKTAERAVINDIMESSISI